MVVNIPDSGLLLESSAKMVDLPGQVFAITLSDSVIEDMIERVKSGGNIELSLGTSPAFLLSDREIMIPSSPEPLEYDLFKSTSTNPTVGNKLRQPAVSVFSASKHKPKATKAHQPKADKTGRLAARPPAPKASNVTPKLAAVSDKDISSVEEDEAIANLKNTYAREQAEKREMAEKRSNASAALGSMLLSKGGKAKPGKAKLLGPQPTSTPRSQPTSPAFAALASPSIVPIGNPAQDRLKQQRFPIIHELAVQESTFNTLLGKFEEGTEKEFSTALNKVADFDENLQKWALKKLYWKELDVFQYKYDREEDRQKAIENAIKMYDRMRIASSDLLWQKLLPEAERNKGVCLSKLQAAIAANTNNTAPRSQKTDASSISGADSEKDESANAGVKKGKGGETMSRSSSQSQTLKKPAASDAQQKRLASNSKKLTSVSAKSTPKATPKASPTKPTATSKASVAKGGRILSKEFVTSSDDEDDEVPLSTLPKTKIALTPATANTARSVERTVEKVRLPDRKEAPAIKVKPAPAAKASVVKKREEEKDTIRAQVPVRAAKAPVKRQRDAEDDDNDSSTSSTTPLSKRLKPGVKAQPAATNKQRLPSDANQTNRANNSAFTKNKNTSPVKSSPLASSPPTNASELDLDRSAITRDNGLGRGRDRENERDTIVSRAGSSTNSSTNSGGSGGVTTNGKKRSAENVSLEGKAKRQRLSEEVLNKAYNFKKCYTRYEALHRELQALQDPPSEKIHDLVEMRERLQQMKDEIYKEAPMEA